MKRLHQDHHVQWLLIIIHVKAWFVAVISLKLNLEFV